LQENAGIDKVKMGTKTGVGHRSSGQPIGFLSDLSWVESFKTSSKTIQHANHQMQLPVDQINQVETMQAANTTRLVTGRHLKEKEDGMCAASDGNTSTTKESLQFCCSSNL
jgi:hypothetical protein